jgi:hypothetical protein
VGGTTGSSGSAGSGYLLRRVTDFVASRGCFVVCIMAGACACFDCAAATADLRRWVHCQGAGDPGDTM